MSGNKARPRDDQLNIELRSLTSCLDKRCLQHCHGFPRSWCREHLSQPPRRRSALLVNPTRLRLLRVRLLSHNRGRLPQKRLRPSRQQIPLPRSPVSLAGFPQCVLIVSPSVPPLLYFPLVTQEIHAWLSGSDAQVAVPHCKGSCPYFLVSFRMRRYLAI